MLKLSCPSCGAEVEFKSKASVFSVCSYCQSTLVRQDMDLTKVGKMAELQDDITPFQVGTKGEYKKEHFEIVGRVKLAYWEGFWNEWYCLFGEKYGWLAEAQGFLAMCFEMDDFEVLPVEKMKLGKRIGLDDFGTFRVDDVNEVTYEFSEGELPFAAQQGKTVSAIDLSGPKSQMASVEYTGSNSRIYIGTYEDFDTFKFKNLRRIDGW